MDQDNVVVYKERGRIRKTTGDRIFNVVNMCVWAVVLFIIIYPLYLIVLSSFSDPYAVLRGEVIWWVKDPSLIGYQAIFNYSHFWRSYLNSFIYTVSGTVLAVVVTMMAAYALSHRFMGKGLVNFFILVPMFFGGGLIPTFLLMNKIGLYNNPLIIVLTGCVTIWNLMVARTYITNSIPYELYEAASIDGASHIFYFTRIILPLSGTIIAVLSIYYGVAFWNDYFTSLVYIRDKNLYPMTLVLRDILAKLQLDQTTLGEMFMDAANISESIRVAEVVKYCAIVLSTVPAVVLYLFMQKYFVKGIMIGSLKG